MATGRLTQTDDAGDFESAMENFTRDFLPVIEPLRSVTVSDARLGVHRFTDGNSTFVHLMNYAYDAAADAVRDSRDVTLTVRADGAVSVHTLDGRAIAHRARRAQEGLAITLEAVPVYCVVEISPEPAGG